MISLTSVRPNERRHFKLPGLSTVAKIGGFALAPFTGGASIPIGLGIGGALDAGQQQGRANEASQQALDAARQDMAARQPFRDQLFASLQQGQPQREDLSNLFQSQNPFAQSLGPLNPTQPQAQAPITPMPIAPPARTRRRGGPVGEERFRSRDEEGGGRLRVM